MAKEWDNCIHFGKGKQKGAGHTGFHVVNSQSVFTGILWRGDSRAPQDTKRLIRRDAKGIFSIGFQPHKAGVTISGRTTSSVMGMSPDAGTTRGGISLSKSIMPCAIGLPKRARITGKPKVGCT